MGLYDLQIICTNKLKMILDFEIMQPKKKRENGDTSLHKIKIDGLKTFFIQKDKLQIRIVKTNIMDLRHLRTTKSLRL